MSGSYAWVSSDISRIAEGGVAIAPNWDFAAGVAWLAAQLNAPVKLPEREIAGLVFICQDCYDEQYHPFSKEQL